MKEGTPITWLFGLFILVAYVCTYVWSAEKENDRLYDIAVDQKEQIELLKEENKQLHELLDVMFQYMNMSPSKNDSYHDPIHRQGPL